MTSTLILGTATGSIGDSLVVSFLDPFTGSPGPGNELHTPTQEQLDLTKESNIRSYVRDYGPFDEMVFTAGVSELKWIKDTRSIDLQRVFQINFEGAVLLAARHAELYPRHKVRYVVLISDAADTPMRGSLAYCASKAALEMAVRCMARELHPTFTVVGVSPGVVEDTGMTNALAEEIPAFRGWTPEQARAYEDKGSVLGRRVTKAEVERTILWALQGPEALNGSIITLNGGK